MKIKKDPAPEPGLESGKPSKEKTNVKVSVQAPKEEKERVARRGAWRTLSDFSATHPRLSSCAFAGIIWGAVIGAGVVGLFGVATFKLNIQTIYGIFLGALIGAFIGGIIGFITGAMPAGAAKPFVTLIVIALILFLGWTAYLAGMTGVLPVYLRRAEPTFGGIWEAFKGSVRCFTSAQNFRGCFIEPFEMGWETEQGEEVVALEVDFKTTSLFYDGKDKEIEAELMVINEPEKGIEKFWVEPECYVGGEKTEIETSGLKEGGKLVFIQRKTLQTASIRCAVPASAIKGKKNIDAEIKLIRPVVSDVKWTLWTLEQDSIFELAKEGEPIPGEGEPKGSYTSLSYAGIPYTLGIGVRESQPLTEGEHTFYIQLGRKTGFTGKLLKEIKFIKVLGIGETASLTSCEEGFKRKGDVFEIENIKEKEDIKEIERGKVFNCNLEVSPEEYENKVVFRAQISYLLEIEYPTSLLLFGAEEEKQEGE